MTYNSALTQTGVYHLPPGTDVMIGDSVTGAGVSLGTVVTHKSVVDAVSGPWNGYATNSTYIVIKISNPIDTSDSNVNNYNYNFITSAVTGLDYGGWSSVMSFSRVEIATFADPIIYLPATTLSFREDVKGWVSFKSFTPENAISCANEYYSFANGLLWQHHREDQARNTFYNVYKESKFTVILNESPGSVKSFQTLNYEGSQARVLENLDLNLITIADGEYYNLTPERGWFVEFAETNLEKGGVNEFIEKEGKWFAYFTGRDASVDITGLVTGGFNSADFSVQGIGRLLSKSTVTISGCMDPYAVNYNPQATNSDGSCIPFVYGCMDSLAINYDPYANTDDGSCVFMGCTDSTAFNYDATANFNDGSCIAVVQGCIDVTAFNYNGLANTDDSSCVAIVGGCTDSGAINYDPAANVLDGSCIAIVNGCMDVTASNYDSFANVNSGCVYNTTGCMDSTALNYDPTANINDATTCIYAVSGCTDSAAANYDPLATVDDGSCAYTISGCTDATACNYDATATSDDGSCEYISCAGCIDSTATNYDATATIDDGSCVYPINGCTDSTACNYDSTATADDGSCETCGDITAVTTDSADATCTSGCLYCYSPTTLTFSNVTATAFTFAWTQPSNSNDGTTNNYSWYIYDAAGFSSTGVTSSTTFTQTGLSAGTTYTVEITRDCSGTNMSALTGTQATLVPASVPGCTDWDGTVGNNGLWGACNFNPLATIDDGTCDYSSCAGCTDSLYLEYCVDCWNDTFENSCITGSGDSNCGVYLADDGTCTTSIVYGCMDSTAFNYDGTANINATSSTDPTDPCIAIVGGCMDDTTDNAGNYATNYDATANTDDGSCIDYACPTLSLNNTVTIVSTHVNNENTIYPLGTPYIVDGAFQSGEYTSFDSVNNYNNSQTFGGWFSWNSNGNIGVRRNLTAINNLFMPGATQFDVVFNLNLNNGLCPGLSIAKSYSVGCLDTSLNVANYNSTAEIHDQSQCEYSGCTDATLVPNTNGVGYTTNYFATNYDPNADAPCTDAAGGSTGTVNDENICCEYTEPSVYFNKVNDDTALELVYDTTDTGFSSAFLGLGLNINGSYNNIQYFNSTNLHNNTFAQDALVNLTTLTTQPLELGVVNAHYAQFGSQVNNTYLNDSHSYTAYFSNTYTYGCRDAATVGNTSTGVNNLSDTTLSQIYPAITTYSNVNPTLDMHEIGSCIEDIPGCQDPNAINNNSLATIDCLTGTCCYYNCSVPNNFQTPQASTLGVVIQVSDQSPTNIGFRITTVLGSSVIETDYFIDPVLGGSNYTLPQPNFGTYVFLHFGADGVGSANGGDDWTVGQKPQFQIQAICLSLDVSAIPPVESTGYSTATPLVTVNIP